MLPIPTRNPDSILINLPWKGLTGHGHQPSLGLQRLTVQRLTAHTLCLVRSLLCTWTQSKLTCVLVSATAALQSHLMG